MTVNNIADPGGATAPKRAASARDVLTLKNVTYALAIIALVIGAWGILDRLVYGHENANYGSYVVWGLWVAMYLFFAGIAAGSFMIATLDLLFHVKVFRNTGQIALWVALVSLAAGLLSIGLDLGHMERIWKVYLNPQPASVMAWMVWGYTVFGLLMLACLGLTIFRPGSRVLRPLMLIGLPLSILASGAVGALLGVLASRLFWHVGLFPVQFPVFSLASGAAAMLAVIGLFGWRDDPNRTEQLKILSITTIILAVVKLYFVFVDFGQTLYGNVPHNVEAVNQVLTGQYAWVFWIVQILIGAVIPIVVLSIPKLARDHFWAGWMGVFVLIGFVAARLLIILPALTVPELDALVTAFTGPHLTYEYTPSLMEWAVTIGTIGMALFGFLIGRDFLPLRSKEAH